MPLNEIAIGAFIGALAAYAVKGAIDLVSHRLSARRGRLAATELAYAANEEIERVRLRQRKNVYKGFDAKLDAAVLEMSQGWTRLSLIYAARDQYQSIRKLASDPITQAAKTMCDICNDMLTNGYNEHRYNRFQCAQNEFREACSQDRYPPRGGRQPTDSSNDKHDSPAEFSPLD